MLLRGAGIVSLLTLGSRLLGLVRHIVIARLFGAGLLADVFFAALQILNSLRWFRWLGLL